MQHYLNCGIGFKTKQISSSDWKKLKGIPNVEARINLNPSDSEFHLTIVPATEDEFNIDNVQHGGSIVLMDSKAMKQMQKNFCFAEVEQYKKAYFPLSQGNKEKILDELKKFGLENYIEEVDVIIYSYCC